MEPLDVMAADWIKDCDPLFELFDEEMRASAQVAAETDYYMSDYDLNQYYNPYKQTDELSIILGLDCLPCFADFSSPSTTTNSSACSSSAPSPACSSSAPSPACAPPAPVASPVALKMRRKKCSRPRGTSLLAHPSGGAPAKAPPPSATNIINTSATTTNHSTIAPTLINSTHHTLTTTSSTITTAASTTSTSSCFGGSPLVSLRTATISSTCCTKSLITPTASIIKSSLTPAQTTPKLATTQAKIFSTTTKTQPRPLLADDTTLTAATTTTTAGRISMKTTTLANSVDKTSAFIKLCAKVEHNYAASACLM